MILEQLADNLLHVAMSQQATDIHFIPRKHSGLIRFRIAGELLPYRTVKKELYQRLLTHFKFLADMDIGEKRKPQSGVLQTKEVELRLSTLPTKEEESLVLRIHAYGHLVSIQNLTLFPAAVKQLLHFTTTSQGLFLFTGPTGSGKTTTLYSLIRTYGEKKQIVTLEDPIEQSMKELVQVQLNEKAGITFATGLKSILRHDPDVILLGEIRDKETAQIAVQAALTGHTVFSTLHTKDSLGAIHRLQDLGVSLLQIEQTVKGVVHQKLATLQCPFCLGICSPFCHRKKRVALFEILTEEDLRKGILEARGQRVAHTFSTIDHHANKGYALGFLSQQETVRLHT